MLLTYFVAAAFGVHGLAHLSGLLAPWIPGRAGFGEQPWLISNGVTLGSWGGKLYGLVWLVAASMLVASGFGLLFETGWWPALPLAACAVSLLAIVPWWKTVVPGARVGALFDLIAIIALASPWSGALLSVLTSPDRADKHPTRRSLGDGGARCVDRRYAGR